jgi:hypothetical protein
LTELQENKTKEKNRNQSGGLISRTCSLDKLEREGGVSHLKILFCRDTGGKLERERERERERREREEEKKGRREYTLSGN